MSRTMVRAGLPMLAAVAAAFWNPSPLWAQSGAQSGAQYVPQPAPAPAAPALPDGGHGFDFLIGDWKAHVRRLPDRLVGSNRWVEYDGISNHHKLLDSNANFEEFEVRNAAGDHLKAQTLRLYNAETRQWSIWSLDVNAGTLSGPPQIGDFTSGRGEFYATDLWKGRAVLIRYLWLNLSPKAARMEQAFSTDAGKTWETNWICELTR